MIWNLNKKKNQSHNEVTFIPIFFSQFSQIPLTKFPSYSDSLFYVEKIYLTEFDNKKRKMDDFLFYYSFIVQKKF